MIALERYVTRLKSAPTDDSAVIEAIRAFYAELNLTNEKYDFGLLETDERELLVPIIVELAQTAGVNPDDYDGEPGGEYRDF